MLAAVTPAGSFISPKILLTPRFIPLDANSLSRAIAVATVKPPSAVVSANRTSFINVSTADSRSTLLIALPAIRSALAAGERLSNKAL